MLAEKKPSELLNIYEKRIKHYKNNGYPFANISPKNVSINEGKIKLDIKISKGQLWFSQNFNPKVGIFSDSYALGKIGNNLIFQILKFIWAILISFIL